MPAVDPFLPFDGLTLKCLVIKAQPTNEWQQPNPNLNS
jgi:hypothetical protein